MAKYIGCVAKGTTNQVEVVLFRSSSKASHVAISTGNGTEMVMLTTEQALNLAKLLIKAAEKP